MAVMAKQPETEEGYLRLFASYVRKWQEKLYLSEWYIYVQFHDSDPVKNKPEFFGCTGKCSIKEQYATAYISVSPYLRPEWYDMLACHEVLHIRFWEAERIAQEDYENGSQSVLTAKIHTAIDRVAMALIGNPPPDNENVYKGHLPPWAPKQFFDAGGYPKVQLSTTRTLA